MYGDFFIAELIEAHGARDLPNASRQAQNDENRALVAEAPTQPMLKTIIKKHYKELKRIELACFSLNRNC